MEVIVPQAAPAQPCPGTPDCTPQVTPVFVLPVTEAENCCVLGVLPDAGRKA